MSRESIRKDLVTAIEAVRTDYGKPIVIEYDNRIVVDTAKDTEPFITAEIKLRDAYQADLGNTKRWLGALELAVAVKKGTGSREAYEILDFFTERLEKNKFGTVRTHVAGVANSTEHLGWVYYASEIYFWSDQFL